ncbi:MAG: hypothetical protein M3460_19445 [Actinomycetota bacterium]|nr:hypothetical protein [Actinomycetota bacterium]
MTDGTNDGSATQSTGNRRVIHASCSVHGGARGFTNLVVHKRDGQIVLDPHATGACVLGLDEDGATVLRDTLTEWLDERAAR